MNEGLYMKYIGLLTIGAILGVAFLCSNNKKRINISVIIKALLMQALLTIAILKTGIGQALFISIARGFEALYQFASQGAQFVFGNLATTNGPWGMVFAFNVLPGIIFFGALMAILFHLGIVQLLVRGMSFIMRPVLGTSGAETLCIAASGMLSQTEAPLLIKHYLARMTDSELLLIMIGGMAHLSGSLLAVYGSMGAPLEHLLTSSIIAIPGAILIAKILIPETEHPETSGKNFVVAKANTKNILDALAGGSTDGMRLAVGVATMLISVISLMALLNWILAATMGYSLDTIFGYLFYWVAYGLGISSSECTAAGSLLGTKLVINEFVAYAALGQQELLERSHIIMTYALAGFANFSSIGIQIGGIGALCPEKRIKLTQLGLKALLGGTLVNLLNAALVGLLI